MKTRVLFVCLGNICRSPMAEAILQHLVRERGLEGAFEIDSAGTGHWHAGESADPRTLAVLARNGVAYDGRARQLRPDDLDRFDVIFAMDEANVADASRIFGRPHGGRLRLVLGEAPVPDPYYGGPEGFDAIYRQLTGALEAWLRSSPPR